MMHPPEEPKKVTVTLTNHNDLTEGLTPEARKVLGKLRDKISMELFHGRGLTGRKLRRATASKLRKSIKLARQGALSTTELGE